jgi:hypothetical protein
MVFWLGRKLILMNTIFTCTCFLRLEMKGILHYDIDFRYWWINKAIIVGRAVRSSHGIAYDAYEVVTKHQ